MMTEEMIKKLPREVREEVLKGGRKAKLLHFGSGQEYLEGWDNADIRGADLNFDFEKFPYPIRANAYDLVYSAGVLDHLKDYFGVMRELYRIIKTNGRLIIEVPFYHCQTSWFPTHYQHFTYLHFYGFSPDHRKNFTEENKMDFENACFRIIKFRTIPGPVGKWIPDLRMGGHLGLRYALGMVFGEIVQRIIVVLEKIDREETRSK